MKKGSIFIFFYCLLVATACQKQSTEKLSIAQQTAIADTIKQLVKVIEEGVNNLDLDSEFRIFTDDQDFTFAEDGKIFPPKDSMRVLFEPIYGSFEQMTFAWDTMRIVVLGPSSAVFTGAGQYSYTTKNGTSTKGNVVGTYIFAKRENRWQLIHGHASHAQEN